MNFKFNLSFSCNSVLSSKGSVDWLSDRNFRWMNDNEDDITELGLFTYVVREEKNGTRGCVQVGQCIIKGDFFKGRRCDVVNVNGDSIGSIEITQSNCQTRHEEPSDLVFPSASFDRGLVKDLETRIPFVKEALRTGTEQYGEELPVWIFHIGDESKKISSQAEMWKGMLDHINSWLPESREYDAERLGQLIGFLPWTCRYLYDKSMNKNGTWTLADEFSMLLNSPLAELRAGDCEDVARTHSLLFQEVFDNHANVCPLIKQYCPFVLDGVIKGEDGKAGLHELFIMVPMAVVLFHWLGYSTSKEGMDLPTLVLESTEWSFTTWGEDSKMKHIAKSLYDSESHESAIESNMTYPFCEEAYREQGYFVRAVVAHSIRLFKEYKQPSYVIHVPELAESGNNLGATMNYLTDKELRKKVRLRGRDVGETSIEQDIAHRYFETRVRTELPELKVGSAIDLDRSWIGSIPVYVRGCVTEKEARSKVNWNNKEFKEIGCTLLKPCDQFGSVYCFFLSKIK